MSPSLESLVVKNPILLVEDDSVAADLIANFLKEKWYSVTHALSYNSAGSLFRSNEFSAALFDTLIPKCDDDLKSELWKTHIFSPFLWVVLAKPFKFKHPGIPVIWMSTDPDNKDRWNWVANIFLEKPLNFSYLSNFLDRNVPQM